MGLNKWVWRVCAPITEGNESLPSVGGAHLGVTQETHAHGRSRLCEKWKVVSCLGEITQFLGVHISQEESTILRHQVGGEIKVWTVERNIWRRDEIAGTEDEACRGQALVDMMKRESASELWLYGCSCKLFLWMESVSSILYCFVPQIYLGIRPVLPPTQILRLYLYGCCSLLLH